MAITQHGDRPYPDTMNTEPITRSDATAETVKFAYDLGANQIQESSIDGGEVLFSTKPVVVTDLEKYRAAPDRTRRSIVFADPQSLVEYLNRFEGAAIPGSEGRGAVPLLVGSLTDKNVVATIDYDKPGAPSWGDHKATYKAAYTPEWAAMRAANGREKSQLDMAEWFDEWSHIVTEPTAGHMADVASNLQGSVNGQFSAKIVRANGSVSFQYTEETETNNVKVPQRIKITCAPFEGTPAFEIVVRFQFRIADRKPVFKVVVENVERIERQALSITFKQIEEAAGLKVLVAP